MTVTWAKSPRQSTWTGSTGSETFEQREKFVITKSKEAGAPSPRLARLTKRTWGYRFVLFARQGGTTARVGLYETLRAAQQAAEEHV